MRMLELPTGTLPGPLAATKPHDRVSEKYSFVETADVMQKLSNLGWNPRRYAYNKAKSRDGFQRHAVEFMSNDRKEFNVGDERARILLINSHDATTQMKFEIGFFRLVCSNGLVVPTGANHSFSLRHLQADSAEISNLIEGMATGLIDAQKKIHGFKRIQLNNNQVTMFARAAVELRKRFYSTELVIDSVIAPNRAEDKATDLWTVFNRIQENIVSGGARQVLVNSSENKPMSRKLLPIASIKNDVEINKGLWNVMENFANGNSKRISQLLSVN